MSSTTDSTSCVETLKSILYFETVKLVTVQSIRFGILHRMMQVLVLLYVVLYSIWLQHGYQQFDNVSGVTFIKVKGVALLNTSTTINIYDSTDFVQPPMESGAVMIVDGMVRTMQQKGICSSSVQCTSDKDCPDNQLTADGLVLQSCNLTTNENKTTGRCLINGWCPFEDPNPKIAKLEGLEEVTIFLRSSAAFPLLGLEASDPVDPVPGRNLFRLSEVLGGSLDQCSAGCIVTATIDWTCDLDHGTGACVPKTTFSKYPGGFNYRRAQYYGSSTQRELQKLYGVRLLVSVVGRGGQFSLFHIAITLGSSVALFTVTTLITDYIIFLIYRSSSLYLGKKYSHFDQERQLKKMKKEEEMEEKTVEDQ